MNCTRHKILNIISVSCKYNKPVLMLWRNCHKKLAVNRSSIVFSSLQKLTFNTCIKLDNNRRYFSTNSGEDRKKSKSKPLMKFDPVLKPEILLTIKNWILTKLIVQPYLDNEFTLKDFTGGAKQALGIVSSLLSEGDFKSLNGLVADDAINEIKSNYSALNVKERQDLLIKVTDILFAFPYQIGIFFDDVSQKRFAEITVVYHCMNDFEELKNRGTTFTENAREDVIICNYRFIREYTKGVQSDWTINRLGHFKLKHFEN